MIVVCSLSDVKFVCESIGPSHLISAIDPGYEPNTPKGVEKHLKLGFDDIIEVSDSNSIFRLNGSIDKQVLPSVSHTNSIIDFLNSWKSTKPIVIHCWCGVSRSMAIATYLICKEDLSNIDKNIRYIRSIAPHANPNKLMVSMFEKYLKVEGKINKTFNKYPHTVTYDCTINFAPVCIFKLSELKKYERICKNNFRLSR